MRTYTKERDNLIRMVQSSETFDTLSFYRSRFLEILEKFDVRDMIISKALHGGSREYLVTLHRYSLSFCLKSQEIPTRLYCEELNGYFLRSQQYLPGHLRGLRQYIVLEHKNGDSLKVIIPFGTVSIIQDGGVKIDVLDTADGKLEVSEDTEANLQFFVYSMHPRFDVLTASSIKARMFLAAIYLATTSMPPDIGIGMTGEAKAIELMRQCFINQPMSNIERFCLENVKSLSRCRSSTVFLICRDIEKSCNSCAFLNQCYTTNGISDEISNERDPRYDDANESTAYLTSLQKPLSSRLHLASSECCQFFRSTESKKCYLSRCIMQQCIDADQCPVTRYEVDCIYALMDKLYIVKESNNSPDDFPLRGQCQTALEIEVYGELKKSWKLHCKELNLKPELTNENNMGFLLSSAKETTLSLIVKLERYLKNVFALLPNHQHHMYHAQAISFFRVVDIVPSATKRDLSAMACSFSKMKEFNSLLSPDAQNIVHSSILLWLELCVLDDKLKYLLSIKTLDSSNMKLFLQEIMAKREWKIEEYPYWLVFEAEQGIRVRPEQYKIAHHLIKENGDVCQLNMGSGKTRVILPLLILFYSFTTSTEHIPRLLLLSKLLNEGFEYFHRTLTASVLGLPTFLIPFQRDVELDMKNVAVINKMIERCKRDGGFIIMAPEHRLSFELKIKELYLDSNKALSRKLQMVMGHQWCDIVDEVDEALHHRFQLVYSTGTVVPLPQGRHRWGCIQALLKVLRCIQIEGIRVTKKSLAPGAFPLIQVDEDIDLQKFRSCIVRSLLQNPPEELIWLKNHPKSDLIGNIVSLPSADPNSIDLSNEHLHDVLSLRGLVAYDILLHCLKKRHRVGYGINMNNLRSGKKSKRLAVPFRGADSPSLRAEFSHPEVVITLTTLAYIMTKVLIKAK